jgi:hypothetical protein
MLNNKYIKGATTNNNIEVNSVSGTLVKNYRKSFFIKCEQDSYLADILFSDNPKLKVPKDTPNALITKTWKSDKLGGDYFKEYYKEIVVIQTMILSNGMLLNEVIWKDDFDEMFEVTDERSNDED